VAKALVSLGVKVALVARTKGKLEEAARCWGEVAAYKKEKDPDLHGWGMLGDKRQRDQTHTGEVAANDVWHLDSTQQFQLSVCSGRTTFRCFQTLETV